MTDTRVLQTRFIQAVGTLATASWYWENECPCEGKTPYNGKYSHSAFVEVGRSDILNDTSLGESLDFYRTYINAPTMCDQCRNPMPPTGVHIGKSYRRLYNTESGKAEPGDMYFIEEHAPDEPCWHAKWTNCDGKHLHVVLPNGGHWDVDSRASNCTMREETTHRCWVRHGEPWNNPTHKLHVDKNGHTCQAGAGSIIYGDWHGFCHHGMLRPC